MINHISEFLCTPIKENIYDKKISFFIIIQNIDHNVIECTFLKMMYILNKHA